MMRCDDQNYCHCHDHHHRYCHDDHHCYHYDHHNCYVQHRYDHDNHHIYEDHDIIPLITCMSKFALLIFGGMMPGGPGSLRGSHFRCNDHHLDLDVEEEEDMEDVEDINNDDDDDDDDEIHDD